MYSTKYSILTICIFISFVLLWCTNADSIEQHDNLIDSSDEDYDDIIEVYRRASLRPIVLHQRASLRPPAGKRASLRPPGKRASLRPPYYLGKRKLRNVIYYDE